MKKSIKIAAGAMLAGIFAFTGCGGQNNGEVRYTWDNTSHVRVTYIAPDGEHTDVFNDPNNSNRHGTVAVIKDGRLCMYYRSHSGYGSNDASTGALYTCYNLDHVVAFGE